MNPTSIEFRLIQPVAYTILLNSTVRLNFLAKVFYRDFRFICCPLSEPCIQRSFVQFHYLFLTAVTSVFSTTGFFNNWFFRNGFLWLLVFRPIGFFDSRFFRSRFFNNRHFSSRLISCIFLFNFYNLVRAVLQIIDFLFLFNLYFINWRLINCNFLIQAGFQFQGWSWISIFLSGSSKI